jgi:hypothetical protein
MWLAARSHISPGTARAWYSHVVAGPMIRIVRRFTGKVSSATITAPNGRLVLEHFNRMQSCLTELVANHIRLGLRNSGEFFDLVDRCEQVHIVTEMENNNVRTARGDYELAQVKLKDWKDIPLDVQRILYSRKLRNRVSNAIHYAPN